MEKESREFIIDFVENNDRDSLKQIIQVQKSLALQGDHLKDKSRSDTGFLISYSSENELLFYLENGGKIITAREPSFGKVLGYLLATPGKGFFRDHPTTETFWDTEGLRLRFQPVFQKGEFLYLSQIGVLMDYHHKNVAASIHQYLLKNYTDTYLIAAVLKEPLLNLRSHKFFEKQGYQYLGEFFTPLLKSWKNVKSSLLLLEKNNR